MTKIFKSAEWTDKSLKATWGVIQKIAREEFKLDFYNPYFEVVTFEEMLQIYTTGFPVMFHHWTFGKSYEELYRQYKANRASIAYEVIFNTDPALCYLLETNSSTMQALVMAHAACGHSAFNKGNEFIKANTNAKTILNVLKNFRDYIKSCENQYGNKRVEEILDVCYSLRLYAVDRSIITEVPGKERERKKNNRIKEQEKDFDLKVAELNGADESPEGLKSNRLKEENLLKFIGKHSPSLKSWERELVNKYCEIEQYFYPQRLTKMMNEGYASFWHYTIMNRLYDLGYIDESNAIEFLDSHTSVLCQHDHDSKYYRGINVYKLGYEIFNDIKRICTNPTDEDKEFFPGLIGKNWIEEVHFAAQNFKDESFILQYLSPKVVRDLKLFSYSNDSRDNYYEITGVHNDEDFKEIRKQLSGDYNMFSNLPYVYIEGADLRKSRALYLVVKEVTNASLDIGELKKTIEYIRKLWNFPVRLRYEDFEGNIEKAEVK